MPYRVSFVTVFGSLGEVVGGESCSSFLSDTRVLAPESAWWGWNVGSGGG